MIKKILLIIIPLVLISVSFFYFTVNATEQLPNSTILNYNLKSETEPVVISDMEKLFERISKNGVSFCCELEEIKIKEETVIPVLVNENYLSVMNLTENGITEDDIISRDKVVIISDSLALRLFFSTDAENKDIEFNNTKYRITDVYKESEGLVNDISKDGKQRIYIPYTVVDNHENLSIDTITYANDSPSASLIEQMDLSQYHSVNFSEKAKVIHTFEHILFLVMFIGFSVIALKVWFLLCRKFLNEIKDNLKENYFLRSINLIPMKYLQFILTGIGIPIALLIIFMFSDFSIYIISKYIPYDNIFDVSHYAEKIVENANLLNSISPVGDNYFSELYANTFSLTGWLLIVFAILFFIAVCWFLNCINRLKRKLIQKY